VVRIVVWLLVAILALAGEGARAQRLDATTGAQHTTIGDPVIIELRATLPAGATLVSDTPSVADSVPSSMRVLDAGGMHRSEGGAYVGRVRMALFRPGTLTIPAFTLLYQRGAGAPVDTLRSRPLPIEIASVLPDLNQVPMRDIKALAPLPGERQVVVWPVVVTLALLAIAAYAAYHTRRRATARGELADAISPAATPYERALHRLASVEREGWAARGDVARHYDEVTDALRRYLEEEHGIHALDRTTPELLRALPDVLSAGSLRTRCAALLDEADLVKFARLRPEPSAADAFLSRARALLAGWHEAAERPRTVEMADAAD
jgi:hypothetical protein